MMKWVEKGLFLFVAIPFEVGQVSTREEVIKKVLDEYGVAIPFEVGQVSTHGEAINANWGVKVSQSLLK